MAAPRQALRRTRLAVAAGFFLQGLVFAAIVTQVPTLKEKIGLGDGDVTILLVVVAVVSGFGSVRGHDCRASYQLGRTSNCADDDCPGRTARRPGTQ